ncbi:MAG: hypothetical protein AB1730_27275 [Myxococcota bacterium]|jgi:hypothetical protein
MTNDALRDDERAELQRLRALVAFDRHLTQRRAADRRGVVSPPQRFLGRARQALRYARWAAPVGAAMAAVGLLFLLTRTSPVVAIGTCAVAAVHALITILLTPKVLR